VLDYIYTSIRISGKNVLLCERGNKGGLFKFNGEVILPCEYEFLESCGYGTHEYWRYSKYKKGKRGIIACNGKLVCDEKYDAVEYSQGNIVVWEKDKCTLLNENGQEQFPFIYEKIRKIFDDPELLAASLNGKFGIIKPNGDVVVACKYTDITEYIYGYAVVSEGYDKVGLINMEGYEVIPTVYSNIEQIDSEYIVVTKNHKKGVIKTNGKQCLPIIYDDIYNISENSAEVKIADKKGTAYFVE